MNGGKLCEAGWYSWWLFQLNPKCRSLIITYNATMGTGVMGAVWNADPR